MSDDRVHNTINTELREDEKDRLKKVSSLIEGFESPFGLELLATVHWAAKSLDKNASITSIKSFIDDWSPRKKQLMSEEQINIAYKRINNYFA